MPLRARGGGRERVQSSRLIALMSRLSSGTRTSVTDFLDDLDRVWREWRP